MEGNGPIRDSRDADSQRAEALLVLFCTDSAEREPSQYWALDKRVVTIGRWEDNDVVIPDRWISRHHASIRREGVSGPGRIRYLIEDLDSKNGLFVNGRRITSAVILEDGDQIQMSPRYSLTFVDSEATAPLFPSRTGVRIDENTRGVWVMGQELTPPLSSAQFTLLRTLAGSPGRVFTREELAGLVWPGEDPAGITDEAVNSLVRRLRKRLMSIDPCKRYIVAVRGHGFKFEQPTANES